MIRTSRSGPGTLVMSRNHAWLYVHLSCDSAACCGSPWRVLTARPAAAQPMMSSAECGTDNLIANRMPSARQDIRGDFRLATDGKAAPEGRAVGRGGNGIFFDTPGGHDDLRPRAGAFGVVVPAAGRRQRQLQDLRRGRGHTVGVQAAGRGRERRQHRPRPADAPGAIEPTAVRFVRIGEPLGDGSYSVSEFQAYCRAPKPFPPKLPIVDAPAAEGRRGALV